MAAVETPELAFMLAPGQNSFFVELAEVLVHELDALGAHASISVGEPPIPRQGVVHVFLPPHEYVALSRHDLPTGVLSRSILISAEQPDSPFFAPNVAMARRGGVIFDINPRAVRAYRAAELEATPLELGHSDLWDSFAPDRKLAPDGRDIDILFLGRLTERRARALASYAGIFERFNCHLGLSDNSRPNARSGAGFAAAETKRALLARSKVLLNLHGEDEPYFEWLRVAEAICAGCAVVSEHATDVAPLQHDRHLVMGRADSLGPLCAWLVDDEVNRDRIRTEAYELLVSQRPMARAAQLLVEAAQRLAAAPVDRLSGLAMRHAHADDHTRPLFSELLQPLERPEMSDGEALILRALKRQQSAMTGLRRDLKRLERRVASGSPGAQQASVIERSPAWLTGAPARLTVLVPLYNHRDFVLDALDSLLRSTRPDWEVVVVDDASTDGGSEAVRDWISRHPDRASMLVAHDVNRGLGATRNSGTAHARTERLLMLDADNEVRRLTMARLAGALDADPDASFSYGIMECFSAEGPQGLLNYVGWEPERLRVTNYIDAFSLIRRDALVTLGGYSQDPRLHGWEDYDLWARMAEDGRHGAFVPEIVGRYRVGRSSMISETNVSTSDAYAAIADHAPKLMAGLRIPR
jgi:Glycosyl transferase family 2